MTHNGTVQGSSASGSGFRPSVVGVAGVALLLVGVSGYTVWRSQGQAGSGNSVPAVAVPVVKTVTALGRLEPIGELIKLSAPPAAEGSRVEQLLVQEGQTVQAGQVIAILDNRDRLQSALLEAEERVQVAQAALDQVRAGAKQGEIQAQQATIARLLAERHGDINAQTATVSRLQAELQNAELEDARYQSLYREGAISASMRDSKRLALQTAQDRLAEAQATLERTRQSRQEQVTEARSTLDRIAEVRPVDVAAAAAEVRYAQAGVQRAKANLALAYVRSPQPGQVLKIHARPGELVEQDGIADIGQTRRMVAVAEVYESDVGQIKRGQVARITSEAIPGDLRGRVTQVGLQVLRQNVVNTDPSANVDSRIVEVRVELDEASSRQVAGLTNLQVKVVIEP